MKPWHGISYWRSPVWWMFNEGGKHLVFGFPEKFMVYFALHIGRGRWVRLHYDFKAPKRRP